MSTTQKQGSKRPDASDAQQDAARLAEANSAVWMCPSAGIPSAEEIAAALYTYSDLAGDYPEPSVPMVREEMRFPIARHGTAGIEGAAERAALGQPSTCVL